MSEEDLERYESEIELALVQEYRAVLPLFSYVVETERRFYLANKVEVAVRSDSIAGLRRGQPDRRLGLGHVPAGPVRAVGPDPDLPGREHRAAAREGPVSQGASGRPPTAAPAGPRRRGRGPGRPLVRGHGYEILERNWRRREGEVDLIVRRGATVVFCEVKTRSTDRFGTGAEAVLPAKQRRIRRLAARWLSELTPASGRARVELRFDVVSITAGQVEVIEDAF